MNSYNRKGISLIELVLAVAIVGIVIQVAYSIYFVGARSYETSKDMGFAQQEIRNLSMVLNNELRVAKEINTTDLGLKYIKITPEVEGVDEIVYIDVNGKEYGPFYNTRIYVDNDDGIFRISVKSVEYPIVEDIIEFRFENWGSFLGKELYALEDGNLIGLSSLYYSKHN